MHRPMVGTVSMTSPSELAEKWRKRAYVITEDMTGTKGNFGKRFKPVGMVKHKMTTQVSVLLSCAAELEAVLDK